jgi:hypothetical protein
MLEYLHRTKSKVYDDYRPLILNTKLASRAARKRVSNFFTGLGFEIFINAVNVANLIVLFFYGKTE